MGHWKFGPLLLDSTSSSSSSCFHSEFPFSCYKAMTDPAKKALTIARTARNENFESFKLSTESWMHSASFISPSQIPYDSFQKLSPLFPPAWLHCNARSTNGLHTTIRTTLLSFTFFLVQLLYYSRRNIERCSNFHLSKAQKIFRKSCSRNGPKPGRKAVYPPICVCTFRRFHNGLKRISAYSILFSASVDLTLFDTWDPSLKRDKSAIYTHQKWLMTSFVNDKKFNLNFCWVGCHSSQKSKTELYHSSKNFSLAHTSWWHEISDKFFQAREKGKKGAFDLLFD